MDKFRHALIEELMLTLKIPQGNFNFATIESEIKNISNDDLVKFYKMAISADSFGNGMKAIIHTAEYFNPKPLEQLEDTTTAEAKRLIMACEQMNTILFDECNKRGIPFDDYVRDYEFKNIQDSTKALLSQIKPYCDYKRLIINIRRYQTSKDALNAFKTAILQSGKKNSAMIENNRVKNMIGRMK